jgi:rhamnosyltransferase
MVVEINVSIIIPVKNGLKWLRNSIPLFFNQNRIHDIELIILDSGSNDGLRKFIISLTKYNIKLIEIDPNEFNHGATRNIGVIHAEHDFLIFTVQDATPIGDEWLISLVEPMISEKLDAICGQQVVLSDKNKNPVQWHRPIDKPTIKKIEITSLEFSKLTPLEQRNFSGWDNVNAAYKKSSLEILPFEEVVFGEDAYWALNALNLGLKIAYTSYSKVDHYHHYSKNQFIDRYLAEFYLFKQLYNLEVEKQRISLKRLIVWFITIIKSHYLPKDIIFWMRYNWISVSAFNQSLEIFNSSHIKNIEVHLSTNRTISTNNSKL